MLFIRDMTDVWPHKMQLYLYKSMSYIFVRKQFWEVGKL